jgi:hypothetical protein
MPLGRHDLAGVSDDIWAGLADQFVDGAYTSVKAGTCVPLEPVRWYGVWLFVDWFEFSGAELDSSDAEQAAKTAAVE